MTQNNRLEEEAAGWLVRQDRGLGMLEQAQFEAWRAQSPVHSVTYLRLKGAWRRIDRLSTRKDQFARPRRALADYISPMPAKILMAAAAALLICGAIGAYFMVPAQQMMVTAVGERRNINLADGTRIELNTNTRLEARQTGSTRTVTLDYGQAYFEVVHDEKHPFVVVAGDQKITDIGTKFSILRTGDTIKIVVADGEVRIDSANGPAGKSTLVGRNMVAVAGRGIIVSEAQSAQQIANCLSWRYGVLNFSDKPLGEVVAELNRYNREQIRVDASARDIRVGGSFRPDNLESFKSILRQMFGVKIEERNGETRISE